MNRQHKAAEYLKLLERIRSIRPDIAISGDFIVGFPGESDADFDDTIRLVIDAVIDPIRICLVAATYWFCVDQVRAQQTASGLEPHHQR